MSHRVVHLLCIFIALYDLIVVQNNNDDTIDLVIID